MQAALPILISFGVSSVGIVLLVLFKQWEAKHELFFYRRIRGYLDRPAQTLYQVVRSIPGRTRHFLDGLFHRIAYHMSKVGLRAVRFVERRLHRFNNMIQGRGEINREKTSASLFLTSISKKEESETVDSSAGGDTD